MNEFDQDTFEPVADASEQSNSLLSSDVVLPNPQHAAPLHEPIAQSTDANNHEPLFIMPTNIQMEVEELVPTIHESEDVTTAIQTILNAKPKKSPKHRQQQNVLKSKPLKPNNNYNNFEHQHESPPKDKAKPKPYDADAVHKYMLKRQAELSKKLHEAKQEKLNEQLRKKQLLDVSNR